MDKKQMNKMELSTLSGIPYSTICDWTSGRTYPNTVNISKLAEVLGINVSQLQNDRSKNRVAVLGRIPAGIPLEAIEEILDYEEISDDMLKGDKEYFALRIAGDSMYPNYLLGDTVIFEKTSDCENGSHCAVMVNGGDATFKKIIKSDKGIILQPLNDKYEPVFYTNDDIINKPVKIIGVAKEIRRKVEQ